MSRLPDMVCIPHGVPACFACEGKSMGKCEHGLTSKECYVCASPKYGERKAMTTDRELAERLRALVALRRGAPLHDSSETEAVWLEQAAARLRAYAEAERVTLCRHKWDGPTASWGATMQRRDVRNPQFEYATFLREPTK